MRLEILHQDGVTRLSFQLGNTFSLSVCLSVSLFSLDPSFFTGIPVSGINAKSKRNTIGLIIQYDSTL